MRDKSDDYWKKKLTPEQYRVLREKGTERPFSGEYAYNFKDGSYYCAGCGSRLFSSKNKYDGKCGWPAFDDVVDKENVEFKHDDSYGMQRVEVLCKNCGGHLGHVFDDDRVKTTGKWYCVNSQALNFEKK